MAYPDETVEKMLLQIKNMEGLIGRDRCKKFTEKTLKAQLNKGVITESEFNDIMQRLDYK